MVGELFEHHFFVVGRFDPEDADGNEEESEDVPDVPRSCIAVVTAMARRSVEYGSVQFTVHSPILLQVPTRSVRFRLGQ